MKEDYGVSSLPIMYIRPPKGWNGIGLGELLAHGDLLQALIYRELTLRYKQTVAGVLWVLGQPLLSTLVLSTLLTRFAGQIQANVPYPLFVYAAFVPWAFFTHALTKSTTCYIEQPMLVTRTYFPRLLLPLAVTIASLVDFGVAFSLMPVLMVIFGVLPSLNLLAFPLVLLLMIVAVFGIGTWLSSLNAEYRDIAFALPFVLQLGLFITPMFYSSEIVPLPWRIVYSLNPMVGVVEGMRWTLLNPQGAAPLLQIAISAVSAVAILAGGLYIHQRREPFLADII